jgi:hypothetical protein
MTSSFQGISPVLVTPLSNTTASRGTKDPVLGSRVTVNGNEYLYAYNAGTTQAVPGLCVIGVTGGTEYSFTISSAIGDRLVGNVLHTTFAAGGYGWLMVNGYTKVLASTTVATDLSFAAGANGYVTTAITYAGQGVVVTTAATGASGAAAYFRGLWA